MTDFWKLIFQGVAEAYQWGAIDSNGAIWLFAEKPTLKTYKDADADLQMWDVPTNCLETTDAQWVGNIPAIGDDAAKTSLVCRKDIDDKQP